VAHASKLAKEKGPKLDDFQILQKLKDIFPDEIPELLPNRGVDFSIDLVPRATCV
jgi:hypothetical protein